MRRVGGGAGAKRAIYPPARRRRRASSVPARRNCVYRGGIGPSAPVALLTHRIGRVGMGRRPARRRTRYAADGRQRSRETADPAPRNVRRGAAGETRPLYEPVVGSG